MKVRDYLEKDKIFQTCLTFEKKRKSLEKQLNCKRMERALGRGSQDINNEIKELCQKINTLVEEQEKWFNMDV